MVKLIRTDLEFILQQILYAEQHAAMGPGASPRSLFPNPEVAFGLRTISGAFNNLVPGQDQFGAADNLFPRMLTPQWRAGEANPFAGGAPTHYDSAVTVFDSQPRIISNLIVDQTANNPAAVIANGGAAPVASPGLDGVFGTADDREVFMIPAQAPDEGLSAPFNSWMTFFGQFFDHGLDLVTKGGNEYVFIPLQTDDPLYVIGSPTNFMVLTRATQTIDGNGDRQTTNTTSPFVDQNQTYSSHPSHQVFLREYARIDTNGAAPGGEVTVSTGRLIEGAAGGMANWGEVKAQAASLLGIQLVDTDIFDVPLLAADAYGNFIPGANGYAQFVLNDNTLLEANPADNGGLGTLIPANALRTGHAFLNDIAHFANPKYDHDHNPYTPDINATPDANNFAGGAPPATGFYDDELLDRHYIAGDGRVNENIGLTAVHSVFHAEHNRLVGHIKSQILAEGDVAFLNQWLLNPVVAVPTTPAAIAALVWDGERIFQAAKVGTEMQYQHLVFEEFARTIQPNVNVFLDFNDEIDSSIVAEFAHTVYRFGHSMLTETVDRYDADFNIIGDGNPNEPGNQQTGLIAAFLNPLMFAASGATPVDATANIVRGIQRQVGNEIDEFVTEALRNNLVGLPLDLAVLNLARGRDAGIPSLNEARRQFFAGTGDSQLKPYASWADFVQNIKHPASLVNFIAAYGTHSTIASATTLADKRAAAYAIVYGEGGFDGDVLTTADNPTVAVPADRIDFLFGTGDWADVGGVNPLDIDGVTRTGLGNIDLWIGGLAEKIMPFGGMLGSTFNFVFETQMEALQDGDRLYYLHRLAGTNFVVELENNSFADIIMRNFSSVRHLPALVFSTPGFTLEVDGNQFNASVMDPGADGVLGDDPNTIPDESLDDFSAPTQDPFGESALLTPFVIRDNPATAGPDDNYLRYTGDEHVVLGGRNPSSPGNPDGDDILIASIGDDTLYGDGGNDILEGGHGNDDLQGGAGDDIIMDMGGDDVIKGGDGNDVIHGGNGLNLIISGRGNDFIVTGEDSSEVFAGEGNDFILGSKLNIQMMGGEGDDWIEIGTQDGAPGDNFDPFGNDAIIGNDVFVGDGQYDEMIGEGGDDIMVGSGGPDKFKGMSGYDWVTYKNDTRGVNVEMLIPAFNEAPLPTSASAVMNKFAGIEGLSGSMAGDILRGDNSDALAIANEGATGSTLTNFALIAGLQTLVQDLLGTGIASFNAGNIILGGAGGDWIEGRGGDDLIEGDAWLNVRISVRANPDGSGAEIASFDSVADMVPAMMAGLYNPGQLTIAREIITGAVSFDTAVFTGLQAEYNITDLGNGVWRVQDTIVGRDGTDTLRSIERLQFGDFTVDLPGGEGINFDPAGQPLTIESNGAGGVDGVLEVGDTLSVSMAGVTDGDNSGAVTGPVSYYWQVELDPVGAPGVFTDILNGGGGVAGGLAIASSTLTLTPDLVGLSIRVRAVYQDAHLVIESVTSAPTAPIAAGPAPGAPAAAPDMNVTAGDGSGVHYIRSDLEFILSQIKLAEAHAAGADITTLVPNTRVGAGLRTVDGSFNNLQDGQGEFGSSDNAFPRMLPAQYRNEGDDSFDANGPAPGGLVTNNNYNSAVSVADADPRIISNLISDQTANNFAAVEANGGAPTVVSPGLDGLFGTADDVDVFEIPNTAPDEGLSAPFNSWMTFFGQFFDHGLDLVSKGGNGTVYIPLQPDDPLFVPGGPNFMALTRATNVNGVVGNHTNQTSPFVDQSQTYASHPSHQVFLREYTRIDTNGAAPGGGLTVATGRLIQGASGGMANWGEVKAQARDMLGIQLTDTDVFGVPMLRTDQYGKFIPGANGYAQIITGAGADGVFNTADDTVIEGNPAANGGQGVSLATAVRIGHAFLDDIAHNAVPGTVFDTDGNPATPGTSVVAPDGDNVAGNAIATDFAGRKVAYDDELLNRHFIAGDGRVNENIGLTTVHHVFHHEHNRLAQQTKDVALATGDLNFLNEWLLVDVTSFPTTPAEIANLVWDGERIFQAAKFGTEMQYQHLVFEEFARMIQPQIDIFTGPTQGYDVNINPAIVAEFAHTVYRFGHSMLTETVDRYDEDFNVVGDGNPNAPGNQQTGLIAAFLNPVMFDASGLTAEQAAGAIVRGVTRDAGNQIDEFVTEALRNNLVGLPLDLPALNIARGRDAGIPSFNTARREFYQATGDSQLKPYTSWADLVGNLKNPASLINFIAAYGTHTELLAADVNTAAEKRAVAMALVLGGSAVINAGNVGGTQRTFTANEADRLDFLNSTGTWANTNGARPTDVDGVTKTGLGNIDFWIGGLAEKIMPFGGMLGSTFNFVFETQLEALQFGDRFYYLDRLAGLNLLSQMENNSFAVMIQNATTATHLPALVFTTPAYTLEVNSDAQFTGLGVDGRDDPESGVALLPLVIRDNPETIGPDTNYLEYTGEDHVVLGGTNGADIMYSGIGDDTIWGDDGNDRIDGGHGNDNIRAGRGDDIITDVGGDDNIQGDYGNDAIHGGNGLNLMLGGFGNDFIVSGEDSSESFGGAGNDFFLGSIPDEQLMGGAGDDWIESGSSDGSPGDNFDPNGLDNVMGHDIYIGDGTPNIMNAEGGDDIMVGSTGPGDKYLGASGFDWATFKDDALGVNIDLRLRAFDATPIPASAANVLARFEGVEGLSGSRFADILTGDDLDATTLPTIGAQGSVLTDGNIDLINGLRTLLEDALGGPVTSFSSGNIILGGDGSDLITGNGGDDIIDGDRWLNVRISIRQGLDANGNPTGPEIGTVDELDKPVVSANPALNGKTLVQLVFAGLVNPGQLQITREILNITGGSDFDTAVFSDVRANYTISGPNADGFRTITHTVGGVPGIDGTDLVRNVERLLFTDQAVVLGGGNAPPVGQATITGLAEEDETLTASIAGVTDANFPGGVIPASAVVFYWQFEVRPGEFQDITVIAGGELQRVTGTTFTPGDNEVGAALRVRAVYQDPLGVIEEVFSAPTAAIANVNDAPTGAPALSDTSPTEGAEIVALTNGIVDVDGLTTPNFTFQWQRSATGGAPWADIVGETGPGYTPTQDDVGQFLRVRVQFTDDGGALEELFSAPSTPVGDLITGDGLGNALAGTPFDDFILGLGGNDNLTGNAGNDIIDGGADNDLLVGGAGNDTLLGGAGLDTLSGGDNDDILNGGAGADNVSGDAGDDTIILTTGEGPDVVDGGLGTDTLNVSGAAGNDTVAVTYNGTVLTVVAGGAVANVERINANLAGGVDTLSYAATATAVAVAVNLAAGTGSGFASILGVENLIGGSGNDSLTGSGVANTITGGRGNDTVDGGLGDDLLLASVPVGSPTDGNDAYIGGAGFDTYSLAATNSAATVNLAAGASSSGITGTDTLSGIEGVIGSGGGDNITGDGAANVLDGGGGADTLNGGAGNDVLVGGGGADTIIGGAGNDLILYSFGDGVDPSYDGGADLDTLQITGTNGGNTLTVVYNGATFTQFSTGGAATTLTNLEAFSANLGLGNDRISYAGTAAAVGVSVNLSANSASGFTSLTNVENVTGGSGNDTIIGTDTGNDLNGGANGGSDSISGLGGNDTLTGGGGDDVLTGGAGNDSITGGAGNDTINYSFGDGNDATIDGGADSDTLNIAGSAANNTLTVTYNGAALTNFNGGGLTGIEAVNADLLGGIDTLSYGGATAAGVSANLAAGAASGFASLAGAENLTGGTGGDNLVGDGGANVLNGGGGNGADTLDGAGGADTLTGGAGADILIGGSGDDVMNGGADNDIFVFGIGFGNDTITGFDENPGGGQDLLDISALGVTAGDFASRVTITQVGAAVLISVDGNTITLIGENALNYNVTDFLLGP